MALRWPAVFVRAHRPHSCMERAGSNRLWRLLCHAKSRSARSWQPHRDLAHTIRYTHSNSTSVHPCHLHCSPLCTSPRTSARPNVGALMCSCAAAVCVRVCAGARARRQMCHVTLARTAQLRSCIRSQRAHTRSQSTQMDVYTLARVQQCKQCWIIVPIQTSPHT